MLWRDHEIGMACTAVAPKALVGVSYFAGERHAERLCATAANQLSVRFVLGFGEALPDGVASLDDALADYPGQPHHDLGTNGGRGPLLITFTARAGNAAAARVAQRGRALAQGAMDRAGAGARPPRRHSQPLPPLKPLASRLGRS
jgi:hypothetical protein